MRHHSSVTVRFSDTDLLGHVNNASYFTYMEEARISFIQHLGIGEMPLIIASAKVDWKAQTYFPETLDIDTWIGRMGRSSFDVAAEMRRQGTDETVFSGVATIVYFDYTSQVPVRIPEHMRAKMEAYCTASLQA